MRTLADLARALAARISAETATAPTGMVRDWLLGFARVNGWA